MNKKIILSEFSFGEQMKFCNNFCYAQWRTMLDMTRTFPQNLNMKACNILLSALRPRHTGRDSCRVVKAHPGVSRPLYSCAEFTTHR